MSLELGELFRNTRHMGIGLATEPKRFTMFTSKLSASSSDFIFSSETSIGTPLITSLISRSSGSLEDTNSILLVIKKFWICLN